jgi:hypothetical protein
MTAPSVQEDHETENSDGDDANDRTHGDGDGR